jgi:D-3-phosphoglycerate dehydrogenase
VLPEASATALAQAIARADAVIARLVPVTADVIAAGQRLRVIGRHGVGLDNVDLGAATRRRIPVVYVPQANSASVAEHAMGMIIALSKRLLDLDRAVRSGRWHLRQTSVGTELDGKTLGVIGLGVIGRLVAQKCSAGLRMRVLGYDPYVTTALPPEVNRVKTLEPLLREADVITVHVPLTAETRAMLGRRELALCKPTAFIINTSRGGVVDELALADALQAGRLAGAALDVFSSEPPPPGYRLLSAPNTVFSPHAASHTEEALRRMAIGIAEDVLLVLRGERPRHVGNPEVYAPETRSR